jgi:S-adenosylmethionine/arginine decarboxylase-like enzyme
VHWIGPPAEDLIFGMRLVLDLHDCDQEMLEDDARLTAFVDDLVAELGMKAYGPCQLWHFGHDDPVTAGYSAESVASGSHVRLRQLIETSSIVGHFSPALRRAYLDVFSCRRYDPDWAIAVGLRHFGEQSKIGRAVVIVS